ncbi:MAG: hypothetical protein NTX03_01885 [Bacteroidetes bacterium]|nr:hypothetical protein [Bacteroidota bacterium]
MKKAVVFKLEIVYGERTDSLSKLIRLFSKQKQKEALHCRLWQITKADKVAQKNWEDFLYQINCKTVEYSIEQFEKEHLLFKPKSYFPTIFLTTKFGMNRLLRREEIDLCEDLESLKISVTEKISALNNQFYLK